MPDEQMNTDFRVIHSSEIADDPAAFAGDYVPLEDVPNDGPGFAAGRFLLNAYGRRCYDAGRKVGAGDTGRAAVPPPQVGTLRALIQAMREQTDEFFDRPCATAEKWADEIEALLPPLQEPARQENGQ